MVPLPSVSIIIPTFNRANLLKNAIKSILKQDYKKIIEIIIVDDHSNDETIKIITNFKRIDKRIKIIENIKHYGLPLCRNIGLSHAKGDLIFFSEDDLILSKNTIRELVNTYNVFSMKYKFKIGGVAPRIILISKNRSYDQANLGKLIIGLINWYTGQPCYNYDIELNRVTIAQHPPSTSLIAKEVFNSIGGYYSCYKINYTREESDFYLRAFKKGYMFIYQPRAIAYHISGYRGGCTVANFFLKNLIDTHNHLIYLIRNYNFKAIYMTFFYFLNKLLKIKCLNKSIESCKSTTVIERIGFYKSFNILKEYLYNLY